MDEDKKVEILEKALQAIASKRCVIETAYGCVTGFEGLLLDIADEALEDFTRMRQRVND